MQGDITCITDEVVLEMNNVALNVMSKQDCTLEEQSGAETVLEICDILYNNTDMNKLPLDDGLYDLLVRWYENTTGNKRVGSKVVRFEPLERKDIIRFIRPETNDAEPYVPKNDKRSEMYDLTDGTQPIGKTRMNIIRNYNIYMRNESARHIHEDLVGTLSKCKFVMESEAEASGSGSNSAVTSVEKDFFAAHIMSGVLDPKRTFGMTYELKYDGVSIEAECTGKILSARTRGDVFNNEALDVTHIFADYCFNNATDFVEFGNPIGVKFEAIMTNSNLKEYNRRRGSVYKNCRTAISSLINSNDGYKYVDLVTLVPLATSMGLERLEEIDFMNNYYANELPLCFVFEHTDYIKHLYLIREFVRAAEECRPTTDFMYDGVVIGYTDTDIIDALGRDRFVNRYQTSVKFSPMVKTSVFRGYSYTVGKNGMITPMVHYDPVEFNGTIHTNSTGHSYKRFTDLGLRYGDILTVSYVNDVMPYVLKAEDPRNDLNTNPCEIFPHICPSCGSVLEFGEKSVYCNNPNCHDRNLKRVASMFRKLGIKNFAEAYLERIGISKLDDVFALKEEGLADIIGPLNAAHLIGCIEEVKNGNLYDYELLGSIGFSGISTEKWKLINKYLSLGAMVALYMSNGLNSLRDLLGNVKVIGDVTIGVIISEIPIFIEDLTAILNHVKFRNSISEATDDKKTVRFTGVRDKTFMEYLNTTGIYDAGEGSVTRTTDILVVPYDGFQSTKTRAVGSATRIVSLNEFKKEFDTQ
jgi:NAD-dependent DNA ligase